LSKDKVRYIGDAIAAVVAETRAQAHDALDAIHVDYELLPVVTTAKEAIEDGAPQLHEAVPNNLNARWTCGDQDATDRAISEADVVVSQSMLNQRTINCPIEPRGAVGTYDPDTEEYTLYGQDFALSQAADLRYRRRQSHWRDSGCRRCSGIGPSPSRDYVDPARCASTLRVAAFFFPLSFRDVEAVVFGAWGSASTERCTSLPSTTAATGWSRLVECRCDACHLGVCQLIGLVHGLLRS
jgi:hypothetical protein